MRFCLAFFFRGTGDLERERVMQRVGAETGDRERERVMQRVVACDLLPDKH